MKPKVLSHNPVSGNNYKNCELANSGIKRILFLSIPLIANGFCTIISLFEISLSENLRIIIGLCYGILLCAYWYQLQENHIALLKEFSLKLTHKLNFFQTENLPQRPPLTKGYLYAKKEEAEFPKPYSMNAQIHDKGVKDIDFNTIYAFYVEIANYYWDGSGYGEEDWNRFKLKCLKEFESKGLIVTRLEDEMGISLWQRGTPSKLCKLEKIFEICKYILFKILIAIGIITPFLFCIFYKINQL